MSAKHYSEDFYESQQEGSVKSAETVVPLVLSTFRVGSVVDVGCGVGGWLREFARNGVENYLGLDGDYVPREALKIPAERFAPTDLRAFEGLDRRFDLAVSLEVAEHLPEDAADRFVGALVSLAPVVLFSAAIPGQGGTDHINEQWQSYWYEKFRAHGYVCLDFIRPQVFANEEIEWWYRQNMLVFCEPGLRPAHLPLASSPYELVRIHPGLLAARESQTPGGREALNAIFRNVGHVGQAIGRKVGAR